MRARIFVFVIVGLQLAMIVRGYWDPHARFAWRPFPEASRFQADIVRVTADGRRVDAMKPWAGGYRWSELVRCCGLHDPRRMRPAKRGIGSTLLYLQDALDWVADHTPRDRDTIYYEARVTYYRNRDGPYYVTLTSKRREP